MQLIDRRATNDDFNTRVFYEHIVSISTTRYYRAHYTVVNCGNVVNCIQYLS